MEKEFLDRRRDVAPEGAELGRIERQVAGISERYLERNDKRRIRPGLKRPLSQRQALRIVLRRVPAAPEGVVVGRQEAETAALDALKDFTKPFLRVIDLLVADGVDVFVRIVLLEPCAAKPRAVDIHHYRRTAVRSPLRHHIANRSHLWIDRSLVVVAAVIVGLAVLPLIAINNSVLVNERNDANLHVLAEPLAKVIVRKHRLKNPFQNERRRSLRAVVAGSEKHLVPCLAVYAPEAPALHRAALARKAERVGNKQLPIVLAVASNERLPVALRVGNRL